MVSLLVQEHKDELERAYRLLSVVAIDSGADNEIIEPLNDSIRHLCHCLEQQRVGLEFGEYFPKQDCGSGIIKGMCNGCGQHTYFTKSDGGSWICSSCTVELPVVDAPPSTSSDGGSEGHKGVSP